MPAKKPPRSVPEVKATVTFDEVIASQKAKRALPSKSDVKEAFGEAAARTGHVNLDMSTDEGRRNRGKLLDMMQPWARAESARGELMQQEVEKVPMRNPAGERVMLPASHEEAAEARGFRTARRGRWTERVVFHEDGSKTVYKRIAGVGVVRVEG